MDKIFFIAALISMGGVVVSLFRGILTMGKNAEKDHRAGNRMMRMRVLFQGLAVAFLFLAYLTKR